MTLEERLTYIADLLSAGRAVNWELGDQAAEAVREYGRGVIGKIAEVAGCTKERINQLIKVAVTYPAEMRHPDTDWSVYRQSYYTAKRLDMEPREVLQMAVDKGLSLAEIAGMGKDIQPNACLRRRCDYCNSLVEIKADGGLAGERIPCPVCAVDGREVLLGVLE